jgi:hypothetical protein
MVEVNMFAKLLSFFYDQKSKGKDNALDTIVGKSNNSSVQRAYNVWKNDNEKLLLSTRDLLVKADLDTSDVDALLRKYHNY